MLRLDSSSMSDSDTLTVGAHSIEKIISEYYDTIVPEMESMSTLYAAIDDLDAIMSDVDLTLSTTDLNTTESTGDDTLSITVMNILSRNKFKIFALR